MYQFNYNEYGVALSNVCIYESTGTTPKVVLTYQDIPAIIIQLQKMYDAWRHVPDVD